MTSSTLSELKSTDSFIRNILPESQRQWMILGLNLLHLLAQNKYVWLWICHSPGCSLAEFHAELELIPTDMYSNVYIKHAMDLEQVLMLSLWRKIHNRLNVSLRILWKEAILKCGKLGRWPRLITTSSSRICWWIPWGKTNDASPLICIGCCVKFLVYAIPWHWLLIVG